MKYELHISDIRSFMQCRRKWHWSSTLPGRMGLEPKTPYAPFFTGRAIHWCLQQYYEQGEPPESYVNTFLERELRNMPDPWPQEVEMINEQTELIRGMLSHYYNWTRKQKGQLFSDDNLRFVSLETEFNVPLITPSGRASPRVALAGRFDGVVQRVNEGDWWLWEVKTAKSISGLTNTLDNDNQAGAYLLAAQALTGHRFSGILYNIMRKKVPSDPRILKSGSLSKAMDQDTTVEHYVKFAHEYFASPEYPYQIENEEVVTRFIADEYGPFLRQLADARADTPFFQRVAIRRTQTELETLQRDLHLISLDMTRPSVHIYPNASWSSCTNCHFKSPCLLLNAGADYEYILEQEYRPRQSWDDLSGVDPK